MRSEQLQRKVTPQYEVGVKRPVFSDDYLQSLNRDNLELVTTSIDTLTERGIRTADGVETPADVIVYATGFDCRKSILPFRVLGTGGRSLEEVWGRCPKAYQGICVPELPNFFLMFGPNTINNRMFMSECAANLVSDAVLQLARSGRSSMAVRRDR